MTESSGTWVCFAVKEEANAFQKRILKRMGVRVLLTGMGRQNAERTLAGALAQGHPPQLVITAGFAGGLSTELTRNTVVFSADDTPGLRTRLLAAGATAVRFHCADRIVTSVAEKQALRANTRCDAVEMESQYIRSMCALHRIPAATVRIILDPANEDLPLDFNQLMNDQQQIDKRKLARHLLKAPGKVAALLRLQQQSSRAAHALGAFLETILSR